MCAGALWDAYEMGAAADVHCYTTAEFARTPGQLPTRPRGGRARPGLSAPTEPCLADAGDHALDRQPRAVGDVSGTLTSAPVAQRVAQLGQRDHLHVAAARASLAAMKSTSGRAIWSGCSMPVSVATIAVGPGRRAARSRASRRSRACARPRRHVAGRDVLHDRRRAAALGMDQEVGARCARALRDVARPDPGVYVALAVQTCIGARSSSRRRRRGTCPARRGSRCRRRARGRCARRR